MRATPMTALYIIAQLMRAKLNFRVGTCAIVFAAVIINRVYNKESIEASSWLFLLVKLMDTLGKLSDAI